MNECWLITGLKFRGNSTTSKIVDVFNFWQGLVVQNIKRPKLLVIDVSLHPVSEILDISSTLFTTTGKLHRREKSGSGCIVRTRPLFFRLDRFWHFCVFSNAVSRAAVIWDLKFGQNVLTCLKIKNIFLNNYIEINWHNEAWYVFCTLFHICSKNI